MLLTACGQRKPSAVPSDTDVQKRLVGIWEREQDLGVGGKYSGVVVYGADGGYAEEGVLVWSNKTTELIDTGTFLVSGGVLITTTSNHTIPTDRVRIVRFDDRELVGQSEEPPDFEPITFRRKR